jgi:hypothetical protein
MFCPLVEVFVENKLSAKLRIFLITATAKGYFLLFECKIFGV